MPALGSSKHALSLTALLAMQLAYAAADARLDPRRLLGSSFGVPGDNLTYDYVVVGGGTAGLTIAARLAQNNAGSVAVVEAGSFYEIGNSNLSQIPVFDGVFASKGKYDWQPLVDWGYVTAPQKSAYDTELHYPRGKCFGGSSSRNYMNYHRGTKGSYRQWADAVGDQSYTFDNWLPYFKRSVHFSPPNQHTRFANSSAPYDATVFDKKAGPLSVTYANYAQAFGSWAFKALIALGMPSIPGFSSGSLLGSSYATFAINATDMTRDSSETSFLRYSLKFTNYVAYPQTLAKKILFDANKKATAVVVNTEGKTYTLGARKEVILSAGVFGSPQLLMVSGVGPASLLQSLKIPVVADRPGVGQNMQDHVYVGPSYPVNAPTTSALNRPDFAQRNIDAFLQNATGMYTSTNVDVVGWEKIPQPLRRSLSNKTLEAMATYPSDWPEMEYLSLSVYLGYQVDSRHSDPNDGKNYASLAVVLTTPRSRGTLSITSPDTAVHPTINPNYFSDPADMELLVAGYKRVRQFWDTPEMKPFVTGPEAFPGRNVSTNAQVADIIKKSFNTIYHAACTNSMGRSNDPRAVVDPKARVYGVKGLRVVDASAFPLLPPGHPMGTVYGLAEKIAADITGV